MSNIGIFHYKVGGTDGVSLEIEKWKHTLEKMGHSVFLCAGDLGTAEGTLIREMYHHLPQVERLFLNTFHRLDDFSTNEAYSNELNRMVKLLEPKLERFIQQKQINLIVPQNIWSVGANPAVAVALANLMRKYKLPALAHHHDFYWERFDGVALTCASAVELAEKYLPPHDPLIKHIVINSIVNNELKARKGIEASVVPNVFKFDGRTWQADEFNQDFRREIGLSENDIFILQATRVIARKGIELAVDLVQALGAPHHRALLTKNGLYDGRTFNEDSRIVLVLAGYTQDDLLGNYCAALKKKIERSGIDAIFIEDLVNNGRQLRNGHKQYSFWDTYVYADLITFPSIWEGWGNQLLEAVYARLPTVIFEYPVYLSDIKEKGFRFVSLGSEIAGRDDLGLSFVEKQQVEDAADNVIDYLVDAQLRKETVEYNYSVGQKYFSCEALQGHLKQLVNK